MKKYGTARQVIDGSTAHASCMLDN